MQQITGYTIENQIGQGGMAIVYRAIQNSLGRTVALKVMNPLLADNPAFSERFLDEGRLLASLQHPHIITIYDIGVSHGMHYISMEYVDGGDLKQRIQSSITPDTALDYTLAIGSGLKMAHATHIVHRDVKPVNILFRRDGSLLLTDFGIAKHLATNKGLTATGSMVGSPHYLSPEQALGKPIDGRADIYSLGIVLYEMLVGEKPFDGDSEIDIALKHISSPLPHLPQKLAHFQPLVDRMTAKNPEDRFSDMDLLLQAAQHLRDAGYWDPTEITTSPDTLAGEKTVMIKNQRISEPPSSDHKWDLALANEGTSLWLNFRRVGSYSIMKLVVFASMLALLVMTAAGFLMGIKDTSMMLGKQAEVTKQTPLAEQAEPDKQKEHDEFVELAKQTEIDKQAERARQNELARQAEAAKQAEQAKQAELTRQAELNTLLQSAQTALSQFKLTTPTNESAYYYYQQVLERDPENVQAIAGFSRISDRYLTLATKAFNEGQTDQAKHYVALGLRIKNDHQGLLALHEQLSRPKANVGRSVNQFFRSVKDIFH